MKKLIFAAAMFAGAVLPAAAQTNVSVSIGQPGFYGRVDIGDYAAPQLVVAQPVIIERQVRYVAEPVYLRVPPHQRRNWARYCYRYEACGRPVYFVRDDWYLNEYAPRYREREYRRVEHVRQPVYVREYERRDYRDRRDDRDHDRHGDKHGRGHDKDDRGHGHGHGRGH